MVSSLLAYGIREQGVKPFPWAFDRGLVAPEFQWFWRSSNSIGIPLWEGGGETLSVYGGRHLPVSGTFEATWGGASDYGRYLAVNDLVKFGSVGQIQDPLPHSWLAIVRRTSTNRFYVTSNNESYSADKRYRGTTIIVGGDPSAVELNVGDNSGGTASDRRSGNSPAGFLADDVWAIISGTIRGLTDMSIYINGAETSVSYSGTGGNLAYSSVKRFNIGDNAAAGRDGDVALVLYAPEAWTSNQHLQLHADPFGPFRMDLSIFLQGLGTPAVILAALITNAGVIGSGIVGRDTM